MKLCEKLYELRRAAGLSQEELAERLSVSRQAVSKWENGVAQPELSKLVELSRLYGVSVDELLSLEEAEKGDPKAEEPSGPAQSLPPAPARTRRVKLLCGAAAVCLIAAVSLALYSNHRVRQLEQQIHSLQLQISSVQSNLSSQISYISSSVREAMEAGATLTEQFDYTAKKFDLDAYTCSVAFSLQPKTVQDDLTVSLRIRSLASGGETVAVELVRDAYDIYYGEAVLPMNTDGFEVTAAYGFDGERHLETLRTLPGFADQALPKLYEDPSFASGYTISYGASVAYRTDSWKNAEGECTANLFLGAYMDSPVRSAWLDYLVDGNLAARTALDVIKADSERAAVSWWPDGIPDAEGVDGVYSICGAEGAKFDIPYGAELEVRFYVELADGTELSALLRREAMPSSGSRGNGESEASALPVVLTRV